MGDTILQTTAKRPVTVMCVGGSRGARRGTWERKFQEGKGGQHSRLKGQYVQEGTKNHVTLGNGKEVSLAAQRVSAGSRQRATTGHKPPPRT